MMARRATPKEKNALYFIRLGKLELKIGIGCMYIIHPCFQHLKVALH